MAPEHVVETDKLTVGYSGVAVVSEVVLHVDRGEVVALLGRNGVGKTTTLHTLAGLIRPISGSLRIGGAEPERSFHRRVRSGLALVTERRAVVRRLTVLENLKIARGSPNEAFEYFPELEELRHRRAGLLSGGEQQMLAFGKLMAQHPVAFLIDELSLGLAPLVVERLLNAVRQAADQGAGVLFVEQQPATALSVADRAYLLAGGKVWMSGAAAEMSARWGEIEHAYLAI